MGYFGLFNVVGHQMQYVGPQVPAVCNLYKKYAFQNALLFLLLVWLVDRLHAQGVQCSCSGCRWDCRDGVAHWVCSPRRGLTSFAAVMMDVITRYPITNFSIGEFLLVY